MHVPREVMIHAIASSQASVSLSNDVYSWMPTGQQPGQLAQRLLSADTLLEMIDHTL